MARLNRLGWFRQVAQIGSAIGREFSYALLRTDSGLPDDALQRRSRVSSLRSWSSSAAHPLMRFTALSTLWCRTRRTAACCAMSAGNRMRRSPKRCKLICPNWGTASPSFSHSIMAKRGWSRNQSPARPRPVIALPPTWRWREAVAQFRKALDQLVLLPTPLNVSDRSPNSAARWVQHCASSKVGCCYAKGIPKLLRSCIAKP